MPTLAKSLFSRTALLCFFGIFGCSEISLAQLSLAPPYDAVTPKLIIPDEQALLKLEATKLSPESQAWQFLRNTAPQLGLSSDLYGLRLIQKQESLLASHFHFQQGEGQIPIEGSVIIVSWNQKTNRIQQLYSTALPRTQASLSNQQKISEIRAYELAWQALGANAEFWDEPKIALRYLPQNGNLRLAYRVEMSINNPYGVFHVWLDADSGELLAIVDPRISHKPMRPPQFSPQTTRKNFHSMLKHYVKQRSLIKERASPTNSYQEGRALVFDPDPRTSLAQPQLVDKSPADAFSKAYEERILPELSFNGQAYILDGPWVKIRDWDPPVNAPSLSQTGQWTAKRGDNAFNDVMSFYHIDKSQRYLQSLGFVDAKGIQFSAIEVDSDGVNGEDNSYYLPSSNRLSFGHGCVDDNEDADVILHEYGHALHFAINPYWAGGDTGAMGEGFGDYWAASYSLSLTKGAQYFPHQVYSWDGQGDCWAGRVLNASGIQYDPSRQYPAHVTIDGGYQSDELWSSPLFQSLRRLLALGIRREEVDTIIIEAQFGLGSQLSLRDMAQSILRTARALFPDGPHARIFEEEFLRLGIIRFPRPEITTSLESISQNNGSLILQPNSQFQVKFLAKNQGELSSEPIQSSFESPSPLLIPLTDKISFGILAPAQQSAANGSYPFQIAPETSCGALLKGELVSRYGSYESREAYEFRVGQALGMEMRAKPMLAIPDADSKGVRVSLNNQVPGKVSPEFKVYVSIKHPYRGDLRLRLISPSGKTLLLRDRKGLGDDDLIGSFPSDFPSEQSLSSLYGESLEGEWHLEVSDMAAQDTGVIEGWGISDLVGYRCEDAN